MNTLIIGILAKSKTIMDKIISSERGFVFIEIKLPIFTPNIEVITMRRLSVPNVKSCK